MKKFTVITTLILIVLFALFISNCDKKVAKQTPNTTPPPAPGACDTITYTKHIAPIMASGCSNSSNSCHGSGSPFADLSNYTAVKAKAEAGRIKARAIDANPSVMPQSGKLPQAQLDLISCWLNNGYKQ